MKTVFAAILAAFFMKKEEVVMDKNTKKDFKDSFETLVIVMLSIFFVAVMNEKCSNVLQKEKKQKPKNYNIYKNKWLWLKK